MTLHSGVQAKRPRDVWQYYAAAKVVPQSEVSRLSLAEPARK